MSKLLRYVALGAAAASLGIASGAQAATTADANASATILTALSVAVETTDDTLNFGTIAPGATAATVIVAPDGSLTGGCPAGLLCTGTTDAPTFDIAGAPNATVSVTFANASETLSNGTDNMTVDTFTTNLPTAGQATLDASGAASFAVGGSLGVSPGQAAGTYTGTLTVNVAYN